jgi:hypothetical protein
MTSSSEYLFELRKKTDALKARAEVLPYRSPTKKQDEVLLHFISRATQIGEACFRVADLVTPLLVLMRVLCEDFFLIFWVAQSEANAVEYANTSGISELARLGRIYLDRNRAKIVHNSTGEDRTAAVLPELGKYISVRKKIESIARDSGLGKVYDIVYRPASMEVHGKTFGLDFDADEGALSAAYPAIISIIEAILLIVDKYPTGTVEPEEILRLMRIEKLGGK